jgi:hypothetical protein
MKYSIKVTNIEGKIQLIKVLRTLEPGLALVEAKALIWEEKIVDLSKIRRARHPLRNYASDFVFSPEEHSFIAQELDDLVDLIVESKEDKAVPSIEEAFRAGFEAGICSDDDVEEAWEKFTANCK